MVNRTRPGASVLERDIRSATAAVVINAIVATAATSHATRVDRGATVPAEARLAW
jgi:hypothetical protein